MGRGGRLRRHPWISLGVVCGVALALVAALGGFRRADPPYPAAAIGEGIDLGRFTLTVEGARLVTTDEDGEPLEDGKRLITVGTRVVNTDTASGSFGSHLVQATFDRETELESDSGSSDAGDFVQPEVRTPFTLSFEVPAETEVADEVTLILLRESFDWNNLVTFGPTWSGGVPFRTVTVPVDQ